MRSPANELLASTRSVRYIQISMKIVSEETREVAPHLVEAVAAHRFTAGMKPEHLKRLVDAAMFKHFERDEVVFREGDPANRFYLISHGKIALESRRNDESAPLVQFVGAGEVLGWSVSYTHLDVYKRQGILSA